MPVINAANVIAILLAVGFAVSGLLKVAAVKRMVGLAAEVHYSVRAYRVIGALEVAAAAGLVLSLFDIAPLGVLAAGGLVMLMGAAAGTHLQNGDPPVRAAPAAALGVVAIGYLVALNW
jgi:hypothetical protein